LRDGPGRRPERDEPVTAKDFKDILPAPIVVPGGKPTADNLSKEWLLANRIGAYASSTVIGCNTRRYHGLLVAATSPPVGRIVALSAVMDQLVVTGGAGAPERTFDLATFEFGNAFAPAGSEHLVEFRNDTAATFVYRCGEAELVKEVILADEANAVAVRYRLAGGAPASLRLWPFLALRDFHALRQAGPAGQMTYLHYDDGIRVEDRQAGTHAVHLSVATTGRRRRGARGGPFHGHGQWWYRFRYRGDLARGQDGFEDLYTPGWFQVDLAPGRCLQLTGSLDDPKEVHFDETVARKRRRLAAAVDAVGPDADETTRRLAVAADAFCVRRKRPNAHPGETIVAGFPWFADWGRDAMIALAGLALETGRYGCALDVLKTFADALDGGMVPNRFDDYGGAPHYNSIDASLWFVIAADRYVRASGDDGAWGHVLAPPAEVICRAYHDGTRFGIRADADGLICGGDTGTQLTWMDVKLADTPVTPRHGKCVEVNALWHAGLRIVADRCPDAQRAEAFADMAGRAAAAFAPTFFNDRTGSLHDCVRDGQPDRAIRPNQILAVALPHCPLNIEQQRSVVETVRRDLLTPVGLRTLAPADPRYRARYGTSWESRDRAYHQGTVWAWLMGPFIEAYLKVHGFSADARRQGRQWLGGFDAHLEQAGIGFISEIFDGDPPHAAGGCIAQAWSVAEVLRAKRLIARGR